MYPVECLKFENRAKGMGFYNLAVNIASFYNTYVTYCPMILLLALTSRCPSFVIGIAFTQAGWKYYFLYIFWDILELACIYFFFVETSNRTLEQLTSIFQSKHPVRASLGKGSITLAHTDAGESVVIEKQMGEL